MKKLLTFAMILALMLSVLTLPAVADEEDEGENTIGYTELAHLDEVPADFDCSENFWDFYWYDEGNGLHENFFSTADGLTSFEYIYLKDYNGDDALSQEPIEKEDAYCTVTFEIEKAGVYDFLIEVMAFETYIPRTGLVQINDGEKYYMSTIHGTNHETWEYFSGLSAYLTVGEHTITVYLGPDFDDTNVKSLFFDNFYYMLDEDAELPTEPETDPVTDPITDPETDPDTDPETDPVTNSETDPDTDPVTAPVTDPETDPTTDAETESASADETEAASTVESDDDTAAATDADTAAATDGKTDAVTEAPEKGCASVVGIGAVVVLTVSAVVILRRKED